MSFRDFISHNFVVGLSPMDGVTDEAFRQVQVSISKPDVIFTEFVSAEGITRGGIKLYDTLLFQENEHPIVGQLFGKDPESFYKAAIILSELGFDGIDINMGCPAKTVTQHGSGAALIEKPDLAVELIKAAQDGISDFVSKKRNIVDLKLNEKTLKVIYRNKKFSLTNTSSFIPTLSVKTRLGTITSQIDTWIPLLLKQNLEFITLHGRTLKQGYAGQADWTEIAKAVLLAKGSKTLIWGNGDIKSRSEANMCAEKYQVNGVLLGRQAMGNPWLFADKTASVSEKFKAMLLHAQIFNQIYPHRHFDCLRKHFILYSSGLKNAKKLREKLVRLNSVNELLELEPLFLN